MIGDRRCCVKNRSSTRHEALLNMQQQYLEALRNREREAVQFIVLLASALGGFAWALKLVPDLKDNLLSFVAISVGVLILLMLGAAHSLALGYNYRYLILQLRKVETALSVKQYVLRAWDKPISCRNETDPACDHEFTPPEIIKQFWIAYLWGIAVVASTASIVVSQVEIFVATLVAFLGIYLIILGAKYIPSVYLGELNAIKRGEEVP